MKHLFPKIRFLLLPLLSLFPTTVHAVLLEDLFKKYRTGGLSEYNELNNTANLPDPDLFELIIEVIQIILRISGILIFLGFTVSGIMFIMSRGEGDGTLLEKAKKTVTYTAIGAVIIMVSYAVVYGITTLTYN